MAEGIPGGPIITEFCKKAKELETYIVAGTILEKEKDNIYYNTSVLVGPTGEVIGKQRKTHPENHASKQKILSFLR